MKAIKIHNILENRLLLIVQDSSPEKLIRELASLLLWEKKVT
jgi:hypothetical protein